MKEIDLLNSVVEKNFAFLFESIYKVWIWSG
jgi:hypothetical protein